MFILFLDVTTNHRCIQSDSIHTIATSPKASSKYRAARPDQFSMNPHGTLAFQVPNCHRYRILRGDTQQQMNMVRLSIPLHQLDIFASAQITQNRSDLRPPPAEKQTLTILRCNHNMVLAVPFHVGLTLPVLHGDHSLALQGLPQGRSSLFSLETAEPLQFSPAEPVA